MLLLFLVEMDKNVKEHILLVDIVFSPERCAVYLYFWGLIALQA